MLAEESGNLMAVNHNVSSVGRLIDRVCEIWSAT